MSPVRAAAPARSHRSRRREVLAGALAALIVFVAATAAVLGWDATHPPRSAGPTPAATTPRPAATTPTQLLLAAADALRAAPSAHIDGTVGGDGSPVRVDLDVTGHGDATGTLVVAGTPVRVVRVGGHTYLQSRELVRSLAGPAVASVVGDRWLVVGPGQIGGTDVNRALDAVTGLDGIASLVATAAPAATVAEPSTVDGVPATEVVAGPAVVDVARSGTPYPLEITAGNLTGVTLDAFGAPVVVRPPTTGVVNLGGLLAVG